MDEQTPQQSVNMYSGAKNNTLAIPLAIVFGFGLIALAVFINGGKQGAKSADPKAAIEQASGGPAKTAPMRTVDENDHIKGNPNAPIMIVEYSDYDCPFCKNFHETMNRVMETYGAGGQVAWAYRHFPIESRHPNAPYVAQASECVAELGGDEAFFKFSDRVFGERGVNDPTDLTRINEFAKDAGVSETAFKSCMESNRTRAAVEEDLTDGVNAGVRGTPHSIVLVGGQQGIINGAQSYEYVSKVLDTLIAELEGKAE
jgi:protein-disulfide isomerase